MNEPKSIGTYQEEMKSFMHFQKYFGNLQKICQRKLFLWYDSIRAPGILTIRSIMKDMEKSF